MPSYLFKMTIFIVAILISVYGKYSNAAVGSTQLSPSTALPGVAVRTEVVPITFYGSFVTRTCPPNSISPTPTSSNFVSGTVYNADGSVHGTAYEFITCNILINFPSNYASAYDYLNALGVGNNNGVTDVGVSVQSTVIPGGATQNGACPDILFPGNNEGPGPMNCTYGTVGGSFQGGANAAICYNDSNAVYKTAAYFEMPSPPSTGCSKAYSCVGIQWVVLTPGLILSSGGGAIFLSSCSTGSSTLLYLTGVTNFYFDYTVLANLGVVSSSATYDNACAATAGNMNYAPNAVPTCGGGLGYSISIPPNNKVVVNVPSISAAFQFSNSCTLLMSTTCPVSLSNSPFP